MQVNIIHINICRMECVCIYGNMRRLTTIGGHGCRCHLVDDGLLQSSLGLMGRRPRVMAKDGVPLRRLRDILLSHLPLRAWARGAKEREEKVQNWLSLKENTTTLLHR